MTVAADEDGQGGLAEVVVTAQRREESLQNVPMSVVAVSQETLDQEGIRSIDDLTRLTPGITFLRNGSSNSFNDEQSNIAIRGVQSTAGAATTGIYIDDTPIQTRHLSYGTADPYPELFDLERVEVLRGPQGTLFGAGSEGGTLRFIRTEPSLTTYSGYDRAEVGQIDDGGLSYEGGAAFGGPIVNDVLGFRVSLSYRKDGGWVDRQNYETLPGVTDPYGNPLPIATGTTEKNSNWHDTYLMSAALKWQPTDTLTVSPSVYAQSLHINDTAMYWKWLSNPSANQYDNGNLNRDANTDPFYLISLKANYSGLSFADLASNTSFFHRNEHSLSDLSQFLNTNYFGNPFPTAAEGALQFNGDHQQNITEELRVTSKPNDLGLTWTGGAFVSRVYENQASYTYSSSFTTLSGLPPVPNNIIGYQPYFDTTDKQYALFGEVSYQIFDALKVTAGARAAHIQYGGRLDQYGLLNAMTNSYTSTNENPVTPRFVISYQATPDSMYYTSAAKGYRPGGINAPLPDVCTADLPIAAPTTYKSDSLWQYEIGTKQTLADHRVVVDASLYYLQWKNIQQLIYLPCGLGFTPNLGDVHGKGGDIQTQFLATKDLTVGLLAAYTDSFFTGGIALPAGASTVTVVSPGDHLPASPWSLEANAEYVVNVFDKKPYIRADYQYSTAQNTFTQLDDPKNTGGDPLGRGLPTIRTLQLRGGIRFDGLDLSLFAQNALNYSTPTFTYRDALSTTNFMLRGVQPRTIGVTATYRY